MDNLGFPVKLDFFDGLWYNKSRRYLLFYRS